MIPTDRHLAIGAFVFDDMDQLDFAGPFEVLSRLPNSTFHIFGKTKTPVRDARSLVLTPTTDFPNVPKLDVLVVPGGSGVNPLMEDAETLAFLRRQSIGLECLFSICTGALLIGAAGLLAGHRATTHWASHDLLTSFGARPVDGRVVMDGNLITAAGVTSGIDAALRVAALLRGETEAKAKPSSFISNTARSRLFKAAA
jgi:cyclohexyl-isocyanide hydratase